ncbi:unnamed protein product [Cylindrotheca closterium]|uniref:Uncharacterized protein n=1 Tax=Cylindrotheca closterium TaxID=2856 RepID=A0AAD2G7Z5_9STRA|nr:unnamed protein product [Cylindrotheca closterium]
MRTTGHFPLLMSLSLPLLSSALMVPQQLHLSPVNRAAGSRSVVSASILEDFEYSDANANGNTEADEMDQKLFFKVRQELVQKYLDQGDDLAKAEREVDYFLSDRARSQQYIEMRKYNLSQLEDGLGLDLFMGLQFTSAFVIGFILHSLSMNAGSFF